MKQPPMYVGHLRAVSASTISILLLLLSGCGPGSSSNSTSSVAVSPSIMTQPENQSVMAGQTATFTVTASGTAPLNYQWQRGGATIAGATAASYTTAPSSHPGRPGDGDRACSARTPDDAHQHRTVLHPACGRAQSGARGWEGRGHDHAAAAPRCRALCSGTGEGAAGQPEHGLGGGFSLAAPTG
jgi:hypothetical protein